MSETDQKDREHIFESSEELSITPTFVDLSLKDDLLQGISAQDFGMPTALQEQALLPIIQGRNVVIRSPPGTGKTTTCCIAAIQSIDPTVSSTQALIISPTRELAERVQGVLVALSSLMDGITSYVCIGGTSVREDKASLQEGKHIVTGTPGRVHDMINRKALETEKIKLLVLNAADQLLDRQFLPKIYEIYKNLSPITQVVVLNSTANVLETAIKIAKDPIQILVKDRIEDAQTTPLHASEASQPADIEGDEDNELEQASTHARELIDYLRVAADMIETQLSDPRESKVWLTLLKREKFGQDIGMLVRSLKLKERKASKQEAIVVAMKDTEGKRRLRYTSGYRTGIWKGSPFV